jgi:N-acetylglucosaminyl-diphospho-decaprenol L-rhamnosyltransferase
MSPLVTVSVVSHRQNRLVNQLVNDIDRESTTALELVLTENVPDSEQLVRSDSFPTEHIVNERPKGFGTNHNAAFKYCRTPFFCVLNPDIRLSSDPFPELTRVLSGPRAGAVGPLIRNPEGSIEDSARLFPTPAALLRKLFSGQAAGPDYAVDTGPIAVDWIAGMCMLFRSETYKELRGFDERYFLYYEDVDLCRRLRQRGFAIIYSPRAEVIHYARRASRHNPRLAFHHALSMARYFLSRVEWPRQN